MWKGCGEGDPTGWGGECGGCMAHVADGEVLDVGIRWTKGGEEVEGEDGERHLDEC